MLTFAPHSSLYPAAFLTEFPGPLAEVSESVPNPSALPTLLQPGAVVSRGFEPLAEDAREELRQSVRDVLREGGHKPTGRGKPSAEYLVRAQGEGKIPSINMAVDACNVVSLHSGLPISVIDLGRATPPLEVSVAGEESYVFNASGQEISLKGLLCLRDQTGPIANAVKDCHRTKTSPETTRTVSVIWGPISHSDYVEKVVMWYRELLAESAGARTSNLV